MLLQVLLVVIVVGAWVFLSSWNNSKARQLQEQKTLQALQLAREALIGWSASHQTTPGLMPCPEDVSAIGGPLEGKAASSCTSANPVIGRLPWRSLNIDPDQGSQGEKLWYVLSPGFRTSPINNTTIGQLTVDGVPNAAVAIIIAPGPPMPGQNRTSPSSGNPPAANDYLDLGNANGPNFSSLGPTTTFNDRILIITQNEWSNAVVKRVLAEIAGIDTNNGLHRYYKANSQYPWADNTGDGHADANQSVGRLPYNDLAFDTTTLNMLSNNAWFSQATYSRNTSYAGQISIGGMTVKAAE